MPFLKTRWCESNASKGTYRLIASGKKACVMGEKITTLKRREGQTKRWKLHTAKVWEMLWSVREWPRLGRRARLATPRQKNGLAAGVETGPNGSCAGEAIGGMPIPCWGIAPICGGI